MTFTRTDTILDTILARKVEEVRTRAAETPLREMRAAAEGYPAPTRGFAAALRRDTVALIAEVKKASPSKGVLIEHFDPVALARTYAANGAAAISVLTDEPFFQGTLGDLMAVRTAVDVPLLRKDFVVDDYQLYEARAAGADAALLIVAALDDAQLADYAALCVGLGLAALVEVHDEGELERALGAGATLIGVNNRDLRTFREDLSTTERLARLVPAEVTLVAESAMRTPADVRRMGRAGAHAVLVGEGLVKTDNIAQTVKAFSSQRREDEQHDDQGQDLRADDV